MNKVFVVFFLEYDYKIVPYNIKTYKSIYIVRNKYNFLNFAHVVVHYSKRQSSISLFTYEIN